MAQCKCGFVPADERDYQSHITGVGTLDDGREHGLIGDFFNEDS